LAAGRSVIQVWVRYVTDALAQGFDDSCQARSQFACRGVMKRKYEGLVAFSKINAAVALVIGLSVFVFGLNGLTRGTPEQFLLLGAAVGFIGGAIWVFAAAAGLDFLSDIEFSIGKPEAPRTTARESKPLPLATIHTTGRTPWI
jgi:hypothetical protein